MRFVRLDRVMLRALLARTLIGALAGLLASSGAVANEPSAEAASAASATAQPVAQELARQTAQQPTSKTSAQAVIDAVAKTRNDPNLGGPHTERRLQFKPDKDKRKPAPADPWLIDFMRWMAEAGRGLVWLLGAVIVAIVIVLAWRWVRVRADAAAGRVSVLPPSHVNDLDIRPDSLPDDIAGTARTLWQRGEQRAALSLLYRGALSRLVHERGVAITSASTEGECLLLAQRVLPASAGSFFERLVTAWQTAVYASRWPDAASVGALCDDFDAHFAKPGTAHTMPNAAPAGAAA